MIFGPLEKVLRSDCLSLKARGLQVRTLQPMHLLNLFGRPLAGVLERAPADAVQIGLGLDLRAAHLIKRRVGQRHDEPPRFSQR